MLNHITHWVFQGMRKLVTLPLATCEVKTEDNQTISLTLSPHWADGVALTHYLKL